MKANISILNFAYHLLKLHIHCVRHLEEIFLKSLGMNLPFVLSGWEGDLSLCIHNDSAKSDYCIKSLSKQIHLQTHYYGKSMPTFAPAYAKPKNCIFIYLFWQSCFSINI